MSDLKKGDEESGHPRIRITLTSRNKEEVEKGASLPLSSFTTRFTRHARSHMLSLLLPPPLYTQSLQHPHL